MKRLLPFLIVLFIALPLAGETLRRLQAYADSGDRDAQFKLGLWYYSGYKVERDYEQAARYFELSAEQNHLEALFLLGYMCFYGEGVAEDTDRGLALFERAALLGHLQAQYDLGYIYIHGLRTPADHAKGEEWMKMAAENDYPKAIEYFSRP